MPLQSSWDQENGCRCRVAGIKRMGAVAEQLGSREWVPLQSSWDQENGCRCRVAGIKRMGAVAE